MNRLHHNGFGAYLVGGSVRDLLLHSMPKDFDVATDARPHQIQKLFRNSHLIGRRFRIVHVQFGREIIEVTTFRAKDEDNDRLKSKDGMILQDNIYGNIHQDAWRRDFTINALYYNIADFSIVDFTGGYEDLKNKVIRLIGDPVKRYQEDPVRMLRAIRFSAKLGFTLDPKTAEPIPKMAHLLKNIPGARLFEEIFKLYHGGKAEKTHQLLCQYGLFAVLFPMVNATLKEKTADHPLIQHVLENTDHRFSEQKPIMPAFLLSALLWYPLQKEAETLRKMGVSPLVSLEKAMSEIFYKQNQIIPIPRKHSQVVREIWICQYRFSRRHGPRPFRFLTHPRFRAAYDFLLIRTLAGEESIELAQWWTTFQEADENTQQKMVRDLNRPTRPSRKK